MDRVGDDRSELGVGDDRDVGNRRLRGAALETTVVDRVGDDKSEVGVGDHRNVGNRRLRGAALETTVVDRVGDDRSELGVGDDRDVGNRRLRGAALETTVVDRVGDDKSELGVGVNGDGDERYGGGAQVTIVYVSDVDSDGNGRHGGDRVDLRSWLSFALRPPGGLEAVREGAGVSHGHFHFEIQPDLQVARFASLSKGRNLWDTPFFWTAPEPARAEAVRPERASAELLSPATV